MRKIVLFIIYSLGLLWSFFMGYKEAHALYQQDLMNEAIASNDNDFFLKFNEKYNSSYTYYNSTDNGTVYVYQTSNQDEDSYSFIIKDLDTSKLVSDDYENFTHFVISGEEGEIKLQLYASLYITSNVYLVTVPTTEVIAEVGDEITNLTFLNQYDVKLFDYDTNITVFDEFDSTNFTSGYTSEELLEIYTFKEVGVIFKGIGIYTGVYWLIGGVYLVVKYFLEKRDI